MSVRDYVWGRRTQPTVGDTNHRQVGLCYVSRRRASNHHSSMFSASDSSWVPTLASCCHGSWTGIVSRVSPFLPKLPLFRVNSNTLLQWPPTASRNGSLRTPWTQELFWTPLTKPSHGGSSDYHVCGVLCFWELFSPGVVVYNLAVYQKKDKCDHWCQLPPLTGKRFDLSTPM